MLSSKRLICSHCQREFSRREHLERHSLTHSNEKPFGCPYCSKSYARRDVLVKHLRRHDPKLTIPTPRRHSARIACDTCHNRKVKCDSSERPCPRCKSADLACTFGGRQDSASNQSQPNPSAQNLLLMEPIAADEPIDSGKAIHEALGTYFETFSTGWTQTADQNPQLQSSADGFGTETISQLDVEQFEYNHMLMPDPYLGISEEISLQSLWPQSQDDPLGGLTTLYGGFPSQFDINIPADGSDVHHTSSRSIDGLDSMQHKRRLAAAYAKVNEYSTLLHPSRPASPTSTVIGARYLQEISTTKPLVNDPLILNIFLGLFQTYIAPIFPCFQQFHITSSHPPEVYQAMAAVGGLYCTTLKSDVIARWLHHFTQRRLLREMYCKRHIDHSRNMAILKTWILTEIFALLSGNKRCVTLLDLFHARMVQVARDCNISPLDPHHDKEALEEVSYTVNLLECYRVVLLQRSTMIFPFSSFSHMINLTQSGNPNDGIPAKGSILSLVRSLVSADGAAVQIISESESLQSLCTLSLLTSHSNRLPGSLSKYLCRSNNQAFEAGLGWRQEFVELALQKWLFSHITSPSAATLLLFHTIHLSIYSNFANIERAAHRYLARQTSSAKDSPVLFQDGSVVSNQMGAGPGLPQSSPSEAYFTSKEARKKALWHAKRILKVAEEMKSGIPLKFDESIHLLREASRGKKGEVIHYSYAVYYASIVIWCPETLNARLSLDEDSQKHDLGARSEFLRQAVNRLSQSTSQVAKVFKQTLYALGSRLETN